MRHYSHHPTLQIRKLRFTEIKELTTLAHAVAKLGIQLE